MLERLKIFAKTIKLVSKKKNISYLIDKDLEKKLNDWYGSVYFEDVLWRVLDLEFNLDKNKMIYLDRITTNNGISFYWDYDLHVSSNDRIDFRIGENTSYDGLLEFSVRKIILSGNDWGDTYKKEYICRGDILDDDFVGFELEKQLDMIVKIIDRTKYIRIQEEFDLTIKVENDNDELILTCLGFKQNSISNEDKLMYYLVDVIKNKSINLEEVFNKVCDIGLGNENFSNFKLELNKNGKNFSNFEFNRYTNCVRSNISRIYTIKCYQDGRKDVVYSYSTPKYYKADSHGILEIAVKYGNYMINFELELNDIRKVSLDNEIELREYLMSLEFPLKLEEVYKRISEITLIDANKYLSINVNIYNKVYVTDQIKLKNGDLVLFYISRDGREITIDKNGHFIYNREDKTSKMNVELDDNIVTNYQCFSSKPFCMDTDKVMENPIQKGIMDAKNERIKMRKLINKYICVNDDVVED